MIALRVVSQRARTALPSFASRGIATSRVSSKDYVQDLYLRELKSYKPREIAQNAHVGQVKEFHTPSAPKAPVVPSSSDLATEIEAYEREEVSSAPSTATSATDSESESAAPGQTADEYLSFVEKEANRAPAPAHH